MWLWTFVYVVSCRFNKLALNGEDGTMIDEVDHFVPVQVQPLVNLCIKEVAFGASHSAFLTGMTCTSVKHLNNLITFEVHMC